MAISVENGKKFPTALVCCISAEGVPFEFGTGAGGKKLEWWAIGPTKKFDDIFSHEDTMHQRDRWTDTRRQQRPQLHIPSHNKNQLLLQ